MPAAVIITEFQKQRVKELFDKGYGVRTIAEIIGGMTRENVKKALKILGLNNSGRMRVCIYDEENPRMQICVKCGKKDFLHKTKNFCYKCRKNDERAIYYSNPLNKVFRLFQGSIKFDLRKLGIKFKVKYILFTKSEFEAHFIKQFSEWMSWSNFYGRGKSKKWRDNDPKTWTWKIEHICSKEQLPYTGPQDENFKKYWSLDNLQVVSNKVGYREVENKRRKERLKNDPAFLMRRIISGQINSYLKHLKISKNGESSFKYLPYTKEELREYIESKFEPWMNWQNHGVYSYKTWDDNDPTTWKWQFDHIIPHSTFSYTSIKDQSFKDCWALSNLRPYSAKQNCIDGGRRTRH